MKKMQNVSSSLNLPGPPAEVKTIVPKDIGQHVISFFAGYKSGLEAALSGKQSDPSDMNTQSLSAAQGIKLYLTDGYEARNDAGTVLAK
jgi:hypothetical protein